VGIVAFIKKSGKTYQVRKGNDGTLLSSFSGKNAKGRAGKELSRLHKKFKPKQSNRGVSAKKKNR